jgi:hypothetical protein
MICKRRQTATLRGSSLVGGECISAATPAEGVIGRDLHTWQW